MHIFTSNLFGVNLDGLSIRQISNRVRILKSLVTWLIVIHSQPG